jgi:hypothetical protein
MANMGSYCKAYPIERFREFGEWTERTENTRSQQQEVDGQEIDVPRVLTEGEHLYLQENYVVTDGIFLDENVIFDAVTDAWVDFCKNQLKFEVPVYEAAAAQSTDAESGG